MSRNLKVIIEWKKILVAVLSPMLVLILADFVLAFLFGSQIRSISPFVFGRNDKETFISLVFLEGGVIFALGAFFASGKTEKITSVPATPADIYKIEKLFPQRPEDREKQISTGILLMLVGGPLLAISFILAITTS